jgi:hypothetical protein
MYYGLLATLLLLYIGWMLKSWRDSLEEGAAEQPARYTRLGDWASRVLMW